MAFIVSLSKTSCLKPSIFTEAILTPSFLLFPGLPQAESKLCATLSLMTSKVPYSKSYPTEPQFMQKNRGQGIIPSLIGFVLNSP